MSVGNLRLQPTESPITCNLLELSHTPTLQCSDRGTVTTSKSKWDTKDDSYIDMYSIVNK